MTACLKAGSWGGAQACSSLVHQESSEGFLSDTEHGKPHLIRACNRITITSGDNTGVTNGCDLIKRERGVPGWLGWLGMGLFILAQVLISGS